jgi:FkbM family methyltransferase
MTPENRSEPLPGSPTGGGGVGSVAQVTVVCNGEARPFHLFDTPLGRRVFEDIITGKSYPLQPSFGEVRTILDVGANVGAAALYFALNYPQARVLAFEPAPLSYDLLVRNTRGLGRVEAFNFGLADQDRRAPLYVGRQDSVTNSVCSSPENTGAAVEVELRAARAVLAEQGVQAVDLLKLDTEGCEVPVLRSLGDLIPRLGVVFVEYHDEEDRREIDRLLGETHVLYQGRVLAPHRGEFCYLARSRLPPGFRGVQIRKLF